MDPNLDEIRKRREEDQAQINLIKERLRALKEDTAKNAASAELAKLRSDCNSLLDGTEKLLKEILYRLEKEANLLQNLSSSSSASSTSTSSTSSGSDLPSPVRVREERTNSIVLGKNRDADPAETANLIIQRLEKKNQFFERRCKQYEEKIRQIQQGTIRDSSKVQSAESLAEQIKQLEARLEEEVSKVEEQKARADRAESELRSIQPQETSEDRNEDLDNENQDGRLDEIPSVMINQSIESNNGNFYLSKLRYLEAHFESDIALATALYKKLGADDITDPEKRGWLTKQGGSVKSWKRRYFVLKDNFLFYYKRPKDVEPTGIIHLDQYGVEEVESDESEKRNCFKITTKPRIWYLRADRQIEMDIWIECVRTATKWYDVENRFLRRISRMDVSALTKPPPVITKKSSKPAFRLSSYIQSNIHKS